jgi:hypothetical protein
MCRRLSKELYKYLAMQHNCGNLIWGEICDEKT